MPLYDYKCPVCYAKREALLKLDELESAVVKCFHCHNAMNRLVSAPYVRGDYAPYNCPVTGKVIEGRRAHIENLKQHNCRVLEPGEREAVARFRQQEDEKLEKAIERTVEAEIHAMPTDKRDKLVAELQNGFTANIERTSSPTT